MDIVNEMNKYLMSRPDEKIISGYRNAMKDYENTGDEKQKIAANIIKQELDRRGIKIDE